MPLMNVVPGVSVNSECIRSVLATLSSSISPHVSIRMDDGECIAIPAERPAEAEALVAEITAKANGEPLPKQAIEAKAKLITDEVSAVFDENHDIHRAIGNWTGEQYDSFLDSICRAVKRHLEGPA